MRVGMLWLDDDKGTSLEDKVLRAADYYRELCLVHTTAVDHEKQVGKIRVQPAGNILRHHFWMGVNK